MKKLFFAALAAGVLVGAGTPCHAENINIGNGTYDFTREVNREVAPGVKYTYFKCSGRGIYGTHVWVTEVDLTNPNVKVEYLTAGGTMGGSTKSLANIAAANTSEKHKVVAGANANFWITSEQPWKSQLSNMPHGTAVSNGTFYSINPRDGQDAHMGGPTTTGSIAIGTDGRAHIRRFFFHNCIYNPRIGHYLDLRDMNRVVTEGSANIYTPGYGRNKAFKPVNLTSSNTWEIAPGTCTELLCVLADGEKLEAGGDTKYIIKEVRTNAGTGTLGNYDLAVVGRDINGAPYATVMAQNYKVGDEIILQHHFVDPNYSVTDWAASAAQPMIMPPFENATSGNCVTMENGNVLTSIIDAQSGYNSNVYARTVYATNNDGSKLWIAVCGNKTSTYYGMTTSQLTYFVKALGATFASQVDCGGSSQMWVDGNQVNKSTDDSNVRSVHSGFFVVSTADESVAPPVNIPDGVYLDEASSYGVNAPESYEMEAEYTDFAIAELAGKTVKRVIARGDILYILAHDAANYPTIVVFNHTTRQVVRTLGVENAVIPGVDNTVNISDIAISADGSLVGMHYATQDFQSTGQGITYRWNKDENGIAYGQPNHWNIHNNSGNYNNAYIGESIAMQGDWKTGKFINTATTTGTSQDVRFTIQQLGTVNQEGQIKSIWHNNLNGVKGYNKADLGDMLLFASPFDANNVILQGTKKTGAEFSLNASAAGVPTLVATIPSVIPANANHTSIFRYGGKIYMTSPTFNGNNNNGVMLVDITGGLASGKQVTLSKSDMPNAATTRVATVGTGVITMKNGSFAEARMAVLAVRNGAVTKFITPSKLVPEYDSPTLTTDATDTEFGNVETGKNASRSFTVAGMALEGDISVDVEGEAFSVSPSSFAKDSGGGTIEVTFAPTGLGDFTGQLTISTPGADPISVNLHGTGVEQVIYTARNHHAYDLSKAEDQETAEITFYSTGDAARAIITFTRATGIQARAVEEPYTVEVSPVVEGENKVQLAKCVMPYAELNWTVEIENYPVEQTGLVYQNAPATLNSKGGVGVIMDPTHPMYGYIVTSNGNAQGFRIYSRDHELVGNYDMDYFSNHGDSPSWTVGNVSSPFRLAIHDNLVYAIDYADAGAGIYTFNPLNPEGGTKNIFESEGATKDSGGCWTLGGVALGGGGSGLCFTGTGPSSKLWSFQEDYPAGNSQPQYVCRWDIGTSENITSAPTKFDALYGNGKSFAGPFMNTNVNLLADGDNGIFLSQNRGHIDGGQTKVLYYIDLDGNIVYDADNEGKPFNSSYAGMALNADRSIFALSCYSEDNGINLYDVTWNGNKPSFKFRETIPGTKGMNAVQMAFDAADNLAAYVQSNEGAIAGLNIFAIAGTGVRIATPAPAALSINASTTAVGNVSIDNTDSNEETRYYDIRGILTPADNLVPGLYIKVTGKKVEKIRVR